MSTDQPTDFATCDLCDAHKNDTDGAFRVLPPVFHDYGGRPKFSGPVSTVKCFEDNSLVKAAVDSPGQGRVLVVDGGGSLHAALMGDAIASLAVENGWEGIVIHGAVRDVAALRPLEIGIKAMGSNPRRSAKSGQGEGDTPVRFGGVTFTPGDYLAADDDGIVVVPVPPAR